MTHCVITSEMLNPRRLSALIGTAAYKKIMQLNSTMASDALNNALCNLFHGVINPLID